ncbi:MAG: AAA family ATPase [Coriobacteriales bacterium]|jgi:AAA+ ATPase superfamily predicted ATPase|nr:AAA family ATPase [Coriobacteriales bacterium]
MRFYGRETELEEMDEIRKQAFSDHSRFTVITGRRRIGKTSLILKSLENTEFAYLFVGNKSEAVLCHEFSAELSRATGLLFLPEIRTLRSLFLSLFEQAQDLHINIVIDEFQELSVANPAFFSDLQYLWDRYKEITHINLVVCGSVFSIMHRLFQDINEPLFGRADQIINLSPFSISTLKEIIKDHSPFDINSDLLALFAITGGVPKYVELFCDNKALTLAKMIDFIIRDNSPLLNEGKNLLVMEFGKNYSTYFSIISAVSQGKNSQNEIESYVGKRNLGGQLKRLVEDYMVLNHSRPLFAKPTSQTVKYEIKDPFIRFWFRFIESNRSMVEMKSFEQLRLIVMNDFETFSGKSLEDYFIQKLALSGKYRIIGPYWESIKGEQIQIDIVAIELNTPRKATAVEVKRNEKEFRISKLKDKVEHLQKKHLSGYDIDLVCLSLADM